MNIYSLPDKMYQSEMIATFENVTYQDLGVSVVLWRHSSTSHHNSVHISLQDVTVLLSSNDLWICQRKVQTLMVQMKAFAEGQVGRNISFCLAL